MAFNILKDTSQIELLMRTANQHVATIGGKIVGLRAEQNRWRDLGIAAARAYDGLEDDGLDDALEALGLPAHGEKCREKAEKPSAKAT